jgi:hypothetical protein
VIIRRLFFDFHFLPFEVNRISLQECFEGCCLHFWIYAVDHDVIDSIDCHLSFWVVWF